jgi:hypothetical protein
LSIGLRYTTLIVEVSGEARKDKAAKSANARTLWVPAINNHGGFGRWALIEIGDPWDAMNTIRAFLCGQAVDGGRAASAGSIIGSCQNGFPEENLIAACRW